FLGRRTPVLLGGLREYPMKLSKWHLFIARSAIMIGNIQSNSQISFLCLALTGNIQWARLADF
ncbi:hypothetical protein QYF50_16325, partial [Paenibacillus vini]|uniref:hypothetical protein n=1 Tax=Paenibacillus vini TaxID=1476024 RepID=UPI0025B6D9C8